MALFKTFDNKVPKYFGLLNLTKQYLRFLSSQGVAWPNYNTLVQWDNFFRYTKGNLYPRNLAAYYPNDPTALRLDGSNNVILWEDRSGNSATNALVLNGVAGNSATTPDAVGNRASSQLDIIALIQPVSWSTGTVQEFVDKFSGSSVTRAYALRLGTTGALELVYRTSGATAAIVIDSTVNTGFAGLTAHWVRATLLADNGSGSSVANFYTSLDGVTWAQLGATVTTSNSGSATINNAAQPLAFGASGDGVRFFNGDIYYASVSTTINGAATAGASFARFTKLAMTGTGLVGETVTINTTGDTGARISGANDLYQGTSSKRPAYTATAGGNPWFMTFDGVDDYLKAASFVLSQPETVYFVGNQIGSTANRAIFDGGSVAGVMEMFQASVSTNTRISSDNASTFTSLLTGWSLGLNAIITSIFNGVSSLQRLNRGAVTNGSLTVSTNANGFTLGTNATVTNPTNVATQEIAIYSEAHNTATQNNIIGYLINKLRIIT